MNETAHSLFLSPRITEFNAFLQEIKKHLSFLKREPLYLETSKYHYNLPSDVKIYNLEEAAQKYKEFYDRSANFFSV